MEFKIEERKTDHEKHYSSHDIDIAREFTKKAYHEFGTLIKCMALFGGHAKHPHHKKPHDIDILMVIDDVRSILTNEAARTYEVICQKMISETSRKIHLTTLKLSEFWDYARKGDPIIINILRDGVPLMDTGIFEPLQLLLYQGKVRFTYESIWAYYSRAPTTINNAKWHIMQGTIDLYWAVIDAAHAALMKIGEMPPTPAHAADMIQTKLVKGGHVHPKYATIMRDFYTLAKGILHREIKEVRGRDFDTHVKQAEDFVEAMKKVITKD